MLQEEKGAKKNLFSGGRLGSLRRGLHNPVSAISVPVLSFCVYDSVKADTEKIRHVQQRKTKLPFSSYHWERFRTCSAAGKVCGLWPQIASLLHACRLAHRTLSHQRSQQHPGTNVPEPRASPRAKRARVRRRLDNIPPLQR